MKEIRTAVAPLVNSQPREILETSSLGVVEIDDTVFFLFLSIHYKIHWHATFYFLAMKLEKSENRKYTARPAGGAATIANYAVPPLNFSVVAD